MITTEYIIRFDGENRFLSNFYDINVEFEGEIYPSTEHAYQAAKTYEKATRDFIKNAATSGIAKKLGKWVQLRPDWEDVKDDIMLDLLRKKFFNNELREKLKATGNKMLVEGNRWHDCYWGVCYCDKCNGMGKNKLGDLLMKVRSEI